MHRIEGAQTEREVCLILPYLSSYFQRFGPRFQAFFSTGKRSSG
jgi:hypothetical protein